MEKIMSIINCLDEDLMSVLFGQKMGLKKGFYYYIYIIRRLIQQNNIK